MTINLHLGDSKTVMATLPTNSVDSIVTDSPYGLSAEPDMVEVLTHWLKGDDYVHSSTGFMGKSWDSFVPGPSVWKEAFRVLKPGGYLLSFFGSRTYDVGTLSIRLAGFEIRDQIMWIYSSGFPKSHNLQGEFKGWGTALKPAHEPIVVARKPLVGTVLQNVTQFGTGALNIDASRVPMSKQDAENINAKHAGMDVANRPAGNSLNLSLNPIPLIAAEANSLGRWPANVIHDGSEEVHLEFAKYGVSGGDKRIEKKHTRPSSDLYNSGLHKNGISTPVHGDFGTPARFFYCAKANSKDRNEGLRRFKKGVISDGPTVTNDTAYQRGKNLRANTHPTVKPTPLMRYLCKLVTPVGGTVLDNYVGSGSTGKGAVIEGFNFIGIDNDPESIAIADARIRHAAGKYKPQIQLFNT